MLSTQVINSVARDGGLIALHLRAESVDSVVPRRTLGVFIKFFFKKRGVTCRNPSRHFLFVTGHVQGFLAPAAV